MVIQASLSACDWVLLVTHSLLRVKMKAKRILLIRHLSIHLQLNGYMASVMKDIYAFFFLQSPH